MATLLLVRHGRTTANADGVLAGWSPGVDLDERGREQAGTVGRRLVTQPLRALVTSPLPRCRTTAAAIAAAQDPARGFGVHDEPGLAECRYGAWTGRPLRELADDPLWRTVQDRPSEVTFPPDPEHEHESMTAMQERAVRAVRRWDARVEEEHGAGAPWAAVSHGDVIKAVVAEALGMRLDDFQRLVVDPGSVTVLRYTPERAFLLRLNDTGSEPLPAPPPADATARGDAAVGGGAGHG